VATQLASVRFKSRHDNGLFSFLAMHSIKPNMAGVQLTLANAPLQYRKSTNDKFTSKSNTINMQGCARSPHVNIVDVNNKLNQRETGEGNREMEKSVLVERLDHLAAELDLLEQGHELVVGAVLHH
jgi:hypothetical protein